MIPIGVSAKGCIPYRIPAPGPAKFTVNRVALRSGRNYVKRTIGTMTSLAFNYDLHDTARIGRGCRQRVIEIVELSVFVARLTGGARADDDDLDAGPVEGWDIRETGPDAWKMRAKPFPVYIFFGSVLGFGPDKEGLFAGVGMKYIRFHIVRYTVLIGVVRIVGIDTGCNRITGEPGARNRNEDPEQTGKEYRQHTETFHDINPQVYYSTPIGSCALESKDNPTVAKTDIKAVLTNETGTSFRVVGVLL